MILAKQGIIHDVIAQSCYLKIGLPLLCSLLFLTACGGGAATEEIQPPTRPSISIEPSQAAAIPKPSATTAPTPTSEPATATAEPSPSPFSPAADFTIIEDVTYAATVDPKAQDQRLDIYVPAQPGGYPPVIWAHGSTLDKSSGVTLAKILAKNGFLVLSIDWRDDFDEEDLARPLRESLEDATCALQLAAEQSGDYGADPEQVIWSGFSAGGWLGSIMALGEGNLAAMWDDYAAIHDGPPQQVRCMAKTAPAPLTALVASSAPFDTLFWLDSDAASENGVELEELAAYSAIGHNPALKVRIIHGNIDRPPMVRGAELFADALAEAGYDVERLPQTGDHRPYFEQVIEQIQALVSQ